MNYSEKVQESVEFADLRNKIQSLLDYLGMETSELEDEREYAIKKNQPMYHQAINNNIKQNYIVSSTLQAIRTDIEHMHDDIQMDIKKEKSASVQSANSTDNA
ncbi:hypothetical protein [Staphylococcus saprophyticus]|jgi:glycine cleavage system regulatory protein|uniref:hypothetical protein n=1 Tax=Staphylococcus saprophyticus TaxID=29385 RepID=UPI001642D96C|nr:hypothetical protein [Staphylococcus saprophyticus]MBC2921532.1 hypothetical protein [Staphylococcus saprophyticus]MBC2957757.1 hypothetical protein [Staphylococcus saprophyticus]MBC3009854.1 hypothetical protein [Staphylococcus saprophyticus]MBC3023851.1 hypothetical protein [Staphylococcus saprophyticus]MBC3030858.1 hypothetical protein [Staphylococcus saprophyticus]